MNPILFSEPTILGATMLFWKLFSPDKSIVPPSNEKGTKALPTNADFVKQKLGEVLNDITIEEFISLINQQLVINTNKVMEIVNANFDAIYTGQLAKA